jgi:hypothetical protein
VVVSQCACLSHRRSRSIVPIRSCKGKRVFAYVCVFLFSSEQVISTISNRESKHLSGKSYYWTQNFQREFCRILFGIEEWVVIWIGRVVVVMSVFCLFDGS